MTTSEHTNPADWDTSDHPHRFPEGPIDMFESFPVCRIPASKLRDDMVIVDPELGIPLYALDHKQRTVRGCYTWYVEDFYPDPRTGGKYHDLPVGTATTLVPVAGVKA